MYYYVYRISNLKEHKHYYGSRKCKCNPEEDLGKKYFSSSSDKLFMSDQIENPNNYKYKVIMVFTEYEKALTAEIKLHERFKVSENPNFYNRQNQRRNGFTTNGRVTVKWADGRCTKFFMVEKDDIRIKTGEFVHFRKGVSPSKESIEKCKQTKKSRVYTFSEERRKIISNRFKGIKWTEERKEMVRKKLKGVPKSKEHKKNLSEANKGKKLSEEHKQNIKKSSNSGKVKVLHIESNRNTYIYPNDLGLTDGTYIRLKDLSK